MRLPTLQHLLEKQVTISRKLCPMSKFLWTHLQEPEIFLGSRVTSFSRDPSRHIETPMWDFYKEIYKQKWYQKGLLIMLEEVHDEYLQASCQGFSALTRRYEHDPQEPQRSRWLQEWDTDWSAPTHSRHTHCISRQLGTTANWRYDVPWDWLWDTCQLARVHLGTRCEGFCSKEGLHYHMEWSARNPMECNKVPRALVESSRSCCQTSNNQP